MATFIAPGSIFISVMVLGYIGRKIIYAQLSKWSGSTQSQIDDILISSTKNPSLIWLIMISIYAALSFSKLSDRVVAVSGKTLIVLGLLSLTLVVANIVSKIIREYSSRLDNTLTNTSLVQNLSRIIIYGVGALVVLNNFGISITPVLATLGVGGLAVALALQDTLSNLFAGFYISLNKLVRIGDYVKLDSGEEGYVTDLNWRTTKIRMLANNMVLVPNSKLTQANIVNYYFPGKDMSVKVDVGVHYKSNLRHVEQVACEVAKETMQQVVGGVPDFTPFIRYHTLGDFSINFTVVLRAAEYADQYVIKHEFIIRLHERFGKEGIIIPYPIKAVNLEQEGVKIA